LLHDLTFPLLFKLGIILLKDFHLLLELTFLLPLDDSAFSVILTLPPHGLLQLVLSLPQLLSSLVKLPPQRVKQDILFFHECEHASLIIFSCLCLLLALLSLQVCFVRVVFETLHAELELFTFGSV
jgi:hypothetical protein